MKNTYLSLCVLVSALSFSQIQEKEIDSIFIFDRSLKNNEKFQKIIQLNSEDIKKNSTSLSELLEFQSSVYIKENGRGMSSSPSFRGTTAQQTAVLWNGININSSFLGQSDLNNISTLDYNQISIKSGGGSLTYGSGAIGGSVHLNNFLSYDRGFGIGLFSEYGSFGTLNTNVKTSYSDGKLSATINGSFVKSDNDYEVSEKDFISRNAKYSKKSFGLGLGYKLSEKHELFWQSQQYFGYQNFLIFAETENKTKYHTRNSRNLLGWDFRSEKILNNLKLAYLEEEYSYFGNIDLPRSTGGISKQFIAKDNFSYVFSKSISADLVSEFINNRAEGYQSGIDKIERNSFGLSFILKHKIFEKFVHEASVKKDFAKDISSPVLFSYGGNVQIFPIYHIKYHVSKNFRYPSFNDLYSQFGGNLDLKSETAHQGEITNEIKWKSVKLELTPFYINLKDMIRWVPNISGSWLPENTHKVESYGLETNISWSPNFNNHFLTIKAGHSYNISKNKETEKQLVYTPINKINLGVNYSYKFIDLFVQSIYNGLTYTTPDEDKEKALDEFFLLNAGIGFSLNKDRNYILGFKANNITNKIYETVAFYPLAKRNYSVNLRLNF